MTAIQEAIVNKPAFGDGIQYFGEEMPEFEKLGNRLQ
jgi:hypothetical protein